MTKPILKFVNAETGEEIEREMTDAEFKKYEANQIIVADKVKAEEDAAIAKTALLARLGITADEAALLIK